MILHASSPAQDYQWPVAQLTPYYFDGEEFGFVCHSASETCSSLFTCYSNKGLIVVSAFHYFKAVDPQSKAKRAFVREFYAKQPQ
jgi:hypothetical protein